MCFGWPEKYDKYVMCGFYKKDGKLISEDGAHVDANSPEDVKEYFRNVNQQCLDMNAPPLYIIH